MTAKARIAIALACAALAVVASHAYAQEARRKEAQLRQETLDRYGGEVVSLVVATHRLDAGETVSDGDVALKEWVSELAPEGALVSLDQAVGSTLNMAVSAGQVLTELSVGSSGSSLEVPSGMVAVSLALTDKLGLAPGIESGSRVFAYRVDDRGTQLVSGKVTVVSVNAEGGSLTSSKNVTVAARPDDIPALLEAAAQGTLRLVVPAGNVSGASAGVMAAPSVVEPLADDGGSTDAASGVASEGGNSSANADSGEPAPGEGTATDASDATEATDDRSDQADNAAYGQDANEAPSNPTSESWEGDEDGR